MKEKKPIFDYREPFNAPYMIREIAKNVTLPFTVYAQDFVVATLSFLVTFCLLLVTVGFRQLTVFVPLAISYGFVQLFNKVEPDGKRVDLFLRDYLIYLVTYALPKKVIYHEQTETIHQEKVAFTACFKKQITRSSNI